MAWNRNDPDPLEARRRQLAEQERQLAEQRKRLTEELQHSDEPAVAQRGEPPVWRLEDDGPQTRVAEPTSARRRDLARQRQRDRFLFIVFGVFLIVVVIVLWVAYLHTISQNKGA
jgi:Flp pilus assembly protein TadB